MEAAKGNGKVQHVTKASSDQLLRKFAEMDSDLAKKELRLAKRRKKILQPKVDATSTSLVFGERKSLLGSQRSVALIPRTAKLRARDIKNRSFLGAIEKTWRRTVQGASKVFIEKHYNRHRRLISDTS
ncbi:hypothetical protein CQW23_11251 [Capsicum baccatum]|uniref:Uncharacterized protein n=1 Tax=Capsicum baccatum TaxID=33114 RepID=A0A2G2WP68_CAPBA|nr:hypothetical protein CQW23_11251 [Capsicum baccatum]